MSASVGRLFGGDRGLPSGRGASLSKAPVVIWVEGATLQTTPYPPLRIC